MPTGRLRLQRRGRRPINPADPPTPRPARPVARNPVMRRPPTPDRKVWITNPAAEELVAQPIDQPLAAPDRRDLEPRHSWRVAGREPPCSQMSKVSGSQSLCAGRGLRLKNADATLNADGRWEAVPGQARRRMVLVFELGVANGGALLERLGRRQMTTRAIALGNLLLWRGALPEAIRQAQ